MVALLLMAGECCACISAQPEQAGALRLVILAGLVWVGGLPFSRASERADEKFPVVPCSSRSRFSLARHCCLWMSRSVELISCCSFSVAHCAVCCKSPPSLLSRLQERARVRVAARAACPGRLLGPPARAPAWTFRRIGCTAASVRWGTAYGQSINN